MLVFLTVLFFVCYPVLMMIGLDNMMTVNDAWRERVALEVLAPGNIGMALVMTVAAAMIAASEFAYLHSKEKMDLYSQEKAFYERIYDRISDVCRNFCGI